MYVFLSPWPNESLNTYMNTKGRHSMHQIVQLLYNFATARQQLHSISLFNEKAGKSEQNP